MQKKAT